MNLIEAFNILNLLNEGNSPKFKSEMNKKIDLTQCRPIETDVIDNRGEKEVNACLNYFPNGATEPILTRVQVRILLTRKTDHGKEFLCRESRFSLGFPGGGYDISKDHGDILETARREIYEEFNIKVTNLKDTGITRWRYREDSFVQEHVKNPEDWWFGYYTYFVTGEYDGQSDNDNPEELKTWKWKPIDLISKIGDKVQKEVAKTINLTEDVEALSDHSLVGDAKGDSSNPLISNTLSYCCEGPVKLWNIIKSHFLKGSTTKETHEKDKIIKPNGRKVSAKYRYISFSRNPFSHAYRRPEKWGFGIAFKRDVFEKKYELMDRDHTYNRLEFDGIFHDAENKNFMVRCGLFGYVPVSKEIYDIISYQMAKKEYEKKDEWEKMSDELQKKFTVKKQPNMTHDQAWTLTNKEYKNGLLYKKDGILNKEKRGNRGLTSSNRDLKKMFQNSEEIIFGGQPYGSTRFDVKFKEFSKEDQDKILNYLLGETYYDEEEERIWLKTDDELGVSFDDSDVYGIILPDLLWGKNNILEWKNDNSKHSLLFEKWGKEQENALEKICEYIRRNNLKIFYHGAIDNVHLKGADVDHSIQDTTTVR